ncbi:MAG: hypothetical protein WA902_12765 [Thermosynechococcaceae cyanobacterium]
MTIERWDDDRLDRFATAVEQAIINLNERAVLMTTAIQQLSDMQNQVLGHVVEMQQEVRGLQTENRRILDRLFGEGDSN